MKATRIYQLNRDAKTRFVSNPGGTRSSKTHSLCQLFISILIENRNKSLVIDVVRKTMPALRASAMRDFFSLLKQYDLYDDNFHNKSENSFAVGKAQICFFSTDDEQKLRGRSRDILWINEANEISREEFFQLNVRTREKVYLDYNPSDTVSWIYNEVENRNDCTTIISTYKDNPFLEQSLIDEIERLKDMDSDHWLVYGEGKRAISSKHIYHNWAVCKEMPTSGEQFYGLDFGYTNPSALVEIREHDGELYLDELLYETGLTNATLIQRLRELNLNMNTVIYADPAEPDKILEMGQAGFNVIEAEKDVLDGIDSVLRFRLRPTERSVNLIKELQMYKRKTNPKTGEVLPEPVKWQDHLMDAMRYAIHNHCKQGWQGKAVMQKEDGEVDRKRYIQENYYSERKRVW